MEIILLFFEIFMASSLILDTEILQIAEAHSAFFSTPSFIS
tara:strand:- start:1624 stop:1746 length:123 start_codon:yes stop_codon:yes gene_type:complete